MRWWARMCLLWWILTVAHSSGHIRIEAIILIEVILLFTLILSHSDHTWLHFLKNFPVMIRDADRFAQSQYFSQLKESWRTDDEENDKQAQSRSMSSWLADDSPRESDIVIITCLPTDIQTMELSWVTAHSASLITCYYNRPSVAFYLFISFWAKQTPKNKNLVSW